jgi:hypothetical protein
MPMLGELKYKAKYWAKKNYERYREVIFLLFILYIFRKSSIFQIKNSYFISL